MPAPPERIALVKLGAIGDVVNTLPFVCRLRAGWPRTRLTWVIAPLAHELVRGHDAVDEFLVLDVRDRARRRAGLRALRAGRHDLVIDLQRILKSGVIARLSGAPRRLGFDRARTKELAWLFTNERIAPNPAPGTTVAQYLEFADHLGLPATPPEWRLPRVAWTDAAPRVALGLGASKPANLWPLEHWAALAARLVAEHGPGRVALVGGPGDRAAADAVLARVPAGLVDTVGRLSLRQTAGLLAASAVFVAGDTGPLHMAVAVGTPVVALFGAADPARTGPYLRPDAVLREAVPCAPCRRRHCNVAGHPCMTGLAVERVHAAIAAQR
ncbi:MAG: glycosyltransferase family 9 protein [Planctomycetes bacterium]|nr:glycosyltransferase family 9 protein [Planctomycetota bacterium]